MTLAISAHGTTLARAKAATPTVFANIAEVVDVTPPEFMRNEFDATTQDKNIDAWILGVLRRNAFTIAINYLPSDTTQDHITGLLQAIITEPPPVDGYKITFPDGTVWVASGQCKAFQPTAPVDGKLAATVTVRLTGKMTINGIVIGN